VSGYLFRSNTLGFCGRVLAAAALCAATIAPVSVIGVSFSFACVHMVFGNLARPRPLEWNPQRTPVSLSPLFAPKDCVRPLVRFMCCSYQKNQKPKNEAHEDRTGASNGDKWKTWITLIVHPRRATGVTAQPFCRYHFTFFLFLPFFLSPFLFDYLSTHTHLPTDILYRLLPDQHTYLGSDFALLLFLSLHTLSLTRIPASTSYQVHRPLPADPCASPES